MFADKRPGSVRPQPACDFPTDLLWVRGVVLGTQRSGTLTMLARGPSRANPPLLFPGRGECNTSLPESHFPFLSNFHTPGPLPFPLLAPPTPSSRWRAPRKEDCGDMRKALFHRLPSPFPTFPPAVFRLFQARGLQTRSIRPFSCDGTLRRNVHFFEDTPAVALMEPAEPRLPRGGSEKCSRCLEGFEGNNLAIHAEARGYKYGASVWKGRSPGLV